MEHTIRQYREDDAAAVVSLSLCAWVPVFASTREEMGDELFERLHGDDWQLYQRESVERVLADTKMRIWVADVDGSVAGFVAAHIHADRRIGEIQMLAVAPERQTRGLGTELTKTAMDWIRDAGIPVAMIDTGGDPGHAPARRTYEKADYRRITVARYFKAL